MKRLKKATEWRGFPLHMISKRNNTPEVHFVSESLLDSPDLESLGFNRDSCIPMHEKFTWAQIVAHIGLFSSAGEARRAGWAIPIEPGFNVAFFSSSNGAPLFVFILK